MNFHYPFDESNSSEMFFSWGLWIVGVLCVSTGFFVVLFDDLAIYVSSASRELAVMNVFLGGVLICTRFFASLINSYKEEKK